MATMITGGVGPGALALLFSPFAYMVNRTRAAISGKGKEETTMTIAEVMTKNPATVSQNDTLAVAARLMWDHDCGALPVVDGAGVPIAMITDRDICMATWSRGLPPDRIRVAQAMSKTLVVCREADAIETAEAAMRLGRVRRLPVVDERHVLVGILSLSDLLDGPRYAGRKRGSSEIAVAGTLAAICRPPEDSSATRAA